MMRRDRKLSTVGNQVRTASSATWAKTSKALSMQIETRDPRVAHAERTDVPEHPTLRGKSAHGLDLPEVDLPPLTGLLHPWGPRCQRVDKGAENCAAALE